MKHARRIAAAPLFLIGVMFALIGFLVELVAMAVEGRRS